MASSRLMQVLKGSARHVPEHLQSHRATPWVQLATSRLSSFVEPFPPAGPGVSPGGLPCDDAANRNAPSANELSRLFGLEPGAGSNLGPGIGMGVKSATEQALTRELRKREDFTPLLQNWYGRVRQLSSQDQPSEGPRGLPFGQFQRPTICIPTDAADAAADEFQGGSGTAAWGTAGAPQGPPSEAALVAEALQAQGLFQVERGKLPGTTAAMRLVEELARSAGQLTLGYGQDSRSGGSQRQQEELQCDDRTPHQQQQLCQQELHQQQPHRQPSHQLQQQVGLPNLGGQQTWVPASPVEGSFESPLGAAMVQRPYMEHFYRPYRENLTGPENHHERSPPSGGPEAASVGQAQSGATNQTFSGHCGHSAGAGRSIDMPEAAARQGAGLWCSSAGAVLVPAQQCFVGSGCAAPAVFGGGHNPTAGTQPRVIPEKKLRRLISNRASAKRSRNRRQDRLQELEVLSVKLKEEQCQAQGKLSEAQELVHKCETENASLKAQVRRMKEAMRLPGGAVSYLPSGTENDVPQSKRLCSDDCGRTRSSSKVSSRGRFSGEANEVAPTGGSHDDRDMNASKGQHGVEVLEFLSFLGCPAGNTAS